MPLPPLPPHVQARIDQLVAEAPPLSPGQQAVLQALAAPVMRDLAARQLAARKAGGRRSPSST
jgi:hypothetical protein